jgi:FkbM family methyltransferase
VARTIGRAIDVAGSLLRPAHFRGFWRTAKILGRLAPPDQLCVVPVGSQSRFAFRLNDPYWSRLLSTTFEYESEIRRILQRLKSTPFSFLDCGANLGYWSVVCSDPAIGCEWVSAVEASPPTYDMLERNRRLNQGAFIALNRAVYSRSGEIVRIERNLSNHAGAAIRDTDGETDAVETITIDDLLKGAPSERPVLVKLDVEGVEIDALMGARETMKRDAMFAFEDHGRDRTCAVTAWILAHTSMSVCYVDEHGGVHRIRSAQEASRFKTDPTKGYNFFAITASSVFASSIL